MLVKYPVDPKKYPVIQEFGFDNTNHPTRGSFYNLFDNKHPGIDFSTPVGTTIVASYAGIVVRREFHKGMGNVLCIRNGNILSLYAHFSMFLVNLGDVVSQQQEIGLSGDTGEACLMPHLHFELRDISKKPLKAMVFEPPFNAQLENFKDTFIYIVSNRNTVKTLAYLSQMYFGSENYWLKINELNNLDLEKDTVIPQDTAVEIPNY